MRKKKKNFHECFLNSHISAPNDFNYSFVHSRRQVLDVTILINDLNITYISVLFGGLEYSVTRSMKAQTIRYIISTEV